MRRLVRETRPHADDLVLPLFVAQSGPPRRPVAAMPGVDVLSVDALLAECEGALADGVGAVMLFGVPDDVEKDALGAGAYADDGIVQTAVRALKRALPQLLVITDVCLCEYTDHGHCGLVADGRVQNDATLDLLARTAVSHAAAGSDIVAPSDMMDGRVGALRDALDAAGFSQTPILSYAVKYASSFYGPFRDAAGSAPQFGDRRSYQMDPAGGVREALREARLDLVEGADMILVKPALAYLDILRAVRDAVDVPVAAYNVSGEYAMVKAAARSGGIDERRAVLEILSSIKRAGADIVFTYHARDAARWLRDE